MSCVYLSVLAARYECKSCGDVRVHLTAFHVDLHVESAAVVTGTLHGALSQVWKASNTRQTHDVARFVHSACPVLARNRQNWHERLRRIACRYVASECSLEHGSWLSDDLYCIHLPHTFENFLAIWLWKHAIVYKLHSRLDSGSSEECLYPLSNQRRTSH